MANGIELEQHIDVIGIEGGGTHTSVVGMSADLNVLERREFGPGNLQLFGAGELAAFLGEIRATIGDASCVGIGMAGLRTEMDRRAVRGELANLWPGAKLFVTDDLETVLAGVPSPEAHAYNRVLMVSGTGSCCFGRRSNGNEAKVGGWGQQLGDEAGAFGIGQSAIRILLREYDRTGSCSSLLRQVLERLSLKHPDDLNAWSARASKAAFAAIAPLIFTAWQRGHRFASIVIEAALERIVEDALICRARLGGRGVTQYILSGGCFRRQARFAARVKERLMARDDRCQIVHAAALGAEGAALLAWKQGKRPRKSTRSQRSSGSLASIVPQSLAMSPTEQRHPGSRSLDRLAIREAIELMAQEDERLPAAIRAESPKIETIIRWLSRRLVTGGRLLYFGAGTSGRLGVLDASECPPTFRTDPSLVQGTIAGGRSALWESVEGAEDSTEAGGAEVARLKVTSSDVVIGIAASGRTPFVWGSLMAAKAVKAKTALICFNPHLKFAKGTKPNLVICPEIGPEILTGSTRLKSGTATKMILNMITTLAMVQCGKVIQNLMIDLNPSNVKLRDRAIRILCELTNVSRERALEALEAESWVVKKAYRRVRDSAR